jgi:hypothetical protein
MEWQKHEFDGFPGQPMDPADSVPRWIEGAQAGPLRTPEVARRS